VENAIPAILIGALLIIASSMLARSGLKSYEDVGNSVKEMQNRMVDQLQSRLTISNVTVDGGGGGLTLNLANVGQTRVATYERVDLILTYFTSPTARVTSWLPYDAGGASANSWTVMSITNDAYEPGILNPGETAVIHVTLAAPVQAGKTNFVLMDSEAGSIASTNFNS
jgi:archaellum component FlaF (FlaF/FlaG flagellin family)